MDSYFLVKTLHIVSSTVLFGTGIGIAFFFLCGMREGLRAGDSAAAWFAARTTVVADMIFTLTAGIVQPLSGWALIHMSGIDPFAPWLVATYVLYLIALACWLPVVRLQIDIRNMWRDRIAGDPVDEALLRRRYRIWFWLGWPAFGALIAIFWLMVAKPVW